MDSRARFYVISGPSGSGKTTICRRIADKRGWYYSVSHTTRPQRDNEIHEKDYFFTKENDFLSMIDRGEFYEWARVYGHYYGTSKKLIEDKLKQGQSVILDVDTQGAAQIKKKSSHAILIFIETPDMSVLQKRLETRGKDSKQEIEKRLKYAQSEISQNHIYDYKVLNDNLEQALERVNKIIDSKDPKLSWT